MLWWRRVLWGFGGSWLGRGWLDVGIGLCRWGVDVGCGLAFEEGKICIRVCCQCRYCCWIVFVLC